MKMCLDLGFADTYINKLESGKIYPSTRRLQVIFDYFGVKPEEFFGEEIFRSPKIVELLAILERNDEKMTDTLLDLARQLDKKPSE